MCVEKEVCFLFLLKFFVIMFKVVVEVSGMQNTQLLDLLYKELLFLLRK